MKIYNSVEKQNPNFGMALHMPSKSAIQKKIGAYVAKQAEIARPALEKLANDIDIFISINKRDNVAFSGFDITVKKSYDDIKNPLVRFWKKFNDKRFTSEDVSNFHSGCMSDNLVRKAAKAKEDFIKYI